MSIPSDIPRIERDLEALEIRLRAVENLETPLGSRIVSDFRELQREVRSINREGTFHSQKMDERTVARFESIYRRMEAVEKWIADQEAEKKSDRRLLRATLISALAAIVVAILSAVIARLP